MDIFSKLPGLIDDPTGQAAREGLNAEGARAERIKFHRTHVRNGPANFKTSTAGQERRARQRAVASLTKKARRSQIRDHFGKLAHGAALRGQLQAAGVLPYEHGGTVDPALQVRATLALVRKFPVLDDEESISFAEADVLQSLTYALHRYNPSADIPEGYVVPVYAEVAA